MLKKEILKAWMREHPSIETWLDRVGESTREPYLKHIYEFFQWLAKNGGEFKDKTPEQLLDLQENTRGRERFKQLQSIQRWIQEKRARLKTKEGMYSAVKSWYAHNHVELPRDPTFTLKSDIPPVNATMALGDLKKIILSSNRLYQAVFLIMFQGAMSEAEFDYFNQNCWPEVREQLNRGKQRLKIYLPGRKRNKNKRFYYTFIGRDAVEALRRYLKQRGPINNGKPIFLNEKGELLTSSAIRSYFRRHAMEIGVIKPVTPNCKACGGETRRVAKFIHSKRKIYYECLSCSKSILASKAPMHYFSIRYGVNPHEIRDVFRSEWDLSQAKGVAAEFFMGHSIDPNQYNKIMKLHPEWAEQQYALAEPYLNIFSEDPRSIPRDRAVALTARLQHLESALRFSLESQGLTKEVVEDVIKGRNPMLEYVDEKYVAEE